MERISENIKQHLHIVGLWCLMILWPVAMGAQESDSLATKPATVTPVKENDLNVDLHFLTHGELRKGGMTTSEADDKSNFIMGRTRLAIDYNRSRLDARVTMQHQGIWGQSGKGSFNLYEAWAKMTAKFGLFFQIGRVALAYDDERIIGPNDWAMASQSHDVLRTGYEGHGHKAHVILAYNQNAENVVNGGNYYVDGAQPYKTMQTAWYHYDVPRVPLGASLLFMNIGMQGGERDKDPHTEFQQLLGGYVSFRPKYWSLEGSFYWQFGNDEKGMRISAWMASAKAVWKPSKVINVEAGYDYMSGDKYFAVPDDGQIGVVHHDVIRGFNPIYGSHHKFYGAMDFFYVSTYVFGFTPGLQNAFGSIIFKPIDKLRLKADYHYLATATQLEGMKRTLGHEFELQASYKFSNWVNLSAGFSYMTGTETMDRLKRANGSGSLNWGWVSLNITPKIFSAKW